jgi:hypothetical protein
MMLYCAEFTKCLDKADLPSCTWYLEQLKAVRPVPILVLTNVDPYLSSARLPLLRTRYDIPGDVLSFR